MNCRITLLILPIILLINGCSSNETANSRDESAWTPPPSGTLVAADSMKIDDPLNNFYFAVKLSVSPANKMSGNYGFVYDMAIHCGPNKGVQQLTMPKGGDNLKPLIRRAKDGSPEFIIGFIPGKAYGGDTTFQEYYSVKAEGKNMSVKALKAYRFN